MSDLQLAKTSKGALVCTHARVHHSLPTSATHVSPSASEHRVTLATSHLSSDSFSLDTSIDNHHFHQLTI